MISAVVVRAAFPPERAKRFIETTLHLHRDAIHIYIGVAVLILAASYFRGRWSGRRLLLPVFVVALLLEGIDLAFAYVSDRQLYGFSFKDIVNTCAIPVIVWFAFLRRAEGEAGSGDAGREND